MKRTLISTIIGAGLLLGSVPSFAATTYRTQAQRRYQARRHYIKHKRRVRTARRIGIGAAGGAAIGAIAGGGKGAAIGAIAGGGAGALYDAHKREQGK